MTSEATLMRQRMDVLRDVLIALSMQVVFRATFLLRQWT